MARNPSLYYSIIFRNTAVKIAFRIFRFCNFSFPISGGYIICYAAVLKRRYDFNNPLCRENSTISPSSFAVSLYQQELEKRVGILKEKLEQAHKQNEELLRGGRVVFRNLGTFDVYGISARVGRNPKRPEAVVTIPPRKLVRFHPGKELKKDVNS